MGAEDSDCDCEISLEIEDAALDAYSPKPQNQTLWTFQ